MDHDDVPSGGTGHPPATIERMVGLVRDLERWRERAAIAVHDANEEFRRACEAVTRAREQLAQLRAWRRPGSTPRGRRD